MNNKRPESFYIQDGVAKAKIFGAPLLIDEVNDGLFYIGYADISRSTLEPTPTLLIKKIEIISTITEISHAYGLWEDRTTLTYIGY